MPAPRRRRPAADGPIPVGVHLPITLGQFVKHAGFAETGGDAKRIVIEGLVKVNCQIEKRRGHKLLAGDVVEVSGTVVQVLAISGVSPAEGRRSERKESGAAMWARRSTPEE